MPQMRVLKYLQNQYCQAYQIIVEDARFFLGKDRDSTTVQMAYPALLGMDDFHDDASLKVNPA